MATPLLGEARWPRRLGAVLLVNVASHPAVWFVFPELSLSRFATVGLSELWAVVLETAGFRLIFAGLTLRRAFGVALLANALSLLLGLLLRAAGLPV